MKRHLVLCGLSTLLLLIGGGLAVFFWTSRAGRGPATTVPAATPQSPRALTDADILRAILAHARSHVGDARHFRYLSLAHLADRKEELERQQKSLSGLFKHLTAPQKAEVSEPAPPAPLDEAGSLIAIDLRALGWDRQPYPGSELTLYDLVLLEYPYAVLPTASPGFPELARHLEASGQVRPIPYVRADWLLDTLLREPLYADFRKVLGRPVPLSPLRPAVRSPQISLPEALAELRAAHGWDGSKVEEKWSWVLPEAALLGLGGPRREDSIDREAWKRYYHRTVAQQGGVPIAPLDGLTWHNHDQGEEPLAHLELIDPATRKPRNTFQAGERMAIRISARVGVIYELFYTSADGQCSLMLAEKQGELVQAGTTVIGRADGDAFTIVGPPGTDHVTLFAYPRERLKVGQDYPGASILHAEGLHDRALHSFYRLQKDGNGLVPPDNRFLLRVTAPLTTLPAPR